MIDGLTSVRRFVRLDMARACAHQKVREWVVQVLLTAANIFSVSHLRQCRGLLGYNWVPSDSFLGSRFLIFHFLSFWVYIFQTMRQSLYQRARLFLELAPLFRTSGLEFSIKTIRYNLTALEVVIVSIIADHDLSLKAVSNILIYWAKCHNKLQLRCHSESVGNCTFNFDHSITEMASDPILDIPIAHVRQREEIEMTALHYYMAHQGINVYPR